MTNPLSSTGALIPHPASAPQEGTPPIRGKVDACREALGPVLRAESVVRPMGNADFKDLQKLAKLIRVYPALADILSSKVSTYLTDPALRGALPYLFAEKKVRMAAVASLVFAGVMAKSGPDAFWANALSSLGIVVFSTLMIETCILGPLNKSGVTEDSILFYANISQKVESFSQLIRNNPTAVKALVAVGLTLTISSHLISKGYTPDPSFATTLLQTVQTAAPQIFNTDVVHTILFALFSLGISPDALSNLLKDVAKASSGATVAYRAMAVCEKLAVDPVTTLKEGHEKIRPLQLEALYEALDEEFKAIDSSIKNLETQLSETQKELSCCQEKLRAAQQELAQTTASTLDSYRGYKERAENTPPLCLLDIRPIVSLQTLQNRKDAEIASKQETVQMLLQKQDRLTAQAARLNPQLATARTSREHFLTTHPETATQLRIYEENLKSSKAFKTKMNLATIASYGWELTQKYMPKSLASREPTAFDALALNIQSLVKKSLIKVPADILARLLVTQGLPLVLNSSLEHMGYDSSSPYVQIPSQVIGWGLFAILLNQYVNTYSTSSIEEEKQKSLEESQLVAALTKKLPSHQQKEVQTGITDLMSALDTTDAPLLARLERASSGISDIASGSGRIPNEVAEILKYRQAILIMLRGLVAEAPTSEGAAGAASAGAAGAASAGAAGAASAGAGIDDESLVLADPARPNKASSLQELLAALEGAYASTEPSQILAERRATRPQLTL